MLQEKNIAGRPLEDLISGLHTSVDGLAAAEAGSRAKDLKNTTVTDVKWVRQVKLFLSQYTSPLVLLLIVAVILSALLGQTSDALIIFFILLATGIMGYWQEANAGNAVEKLKAMIALKHSVLRDGRPVEIPTEEVVPGDVLLFNAGDIIPADCRLIQANELHVNESSLTGESFSVQKIPGIVSDSEPLARKINCLWQGTSVVSGTGRALAVNVGRNTLFGQLAKTLKRSSATAFEKDIRQFGNFLLRVTLVLVLVILLINLYFKRPFFDSILFSLALAIGMAPELLPAILSFAMSAGARRLLKKKVIVKKLSSIFNFGEVNVLCTDKTGTITEGKTQLKSIVDWQGKENAELAQMAYLNAAFQQGFKNPVDDALLSLSLTTGDFRKADEIPYDFQRKRLTVLVSQNGQYLMVTKGAFDNVMDVCTAYGTEDRPLQDADRQAITAIFADYGRNGLRVMALATKKTSASSITREDERQMVFRGFILMEDPIKDSTLASIARLRQMHVKVKIITGDNRYAAAHVAAQLGLNENNILTGDRLNATSSEALVVQVGKADVFAEIEPNQKDSIIAALQKAGNTVAYMGDGINDVAAIHTADCGISANNAVDVAKDAADFVLMEKDLGVLADGVAEGRGSFINSMKYIFINTGANFGNMFSVAAASLLLPFLPMLPKQILLINFLTDFPYLAIAYDRVDNEQLVYPQKWSMKLIRNFMIVFGLHSSLFDILTFYVLYHRLGLSNDAFRTGWFIESVITELFILFIIRTRKPFLKSQPGKILIWTSLLSLLITVWLPYSPFASLLGLTVQSGNAILAIILILALYVLTADWLKILFFRYNK